MKNGYDHFFCFIKASCGIFKAEKVKPAMQIPMPVSGRIWNQGPLNQIACGRRRYV
jgi:hypothetical protein